MKSLDLGVDVDDFSLDGCLTVLSLKPGSST